MTTMQEYLENPHWRAQYRYTMGPPNGGYYKRWIQGSVGMMEPLPLWSNEYSHVYMKHGQNNILPYRGNLKKFAPSVTPKLLEQVLECSLDTVNPAGCQDAAIRRVFTTDSSPEHHSRQHTHPLFARHSPDNTPHPFDANYQTGTYIHQPIIPPNTRYQG